MCFEGGQDATRFVVALRIVSTVHTMITRTRNQAASAWMLVACGLWLTALGLYFIFFRPPLLPEDLRFMNASLTQVRAALPDLEGWLHRVFIVMGGFMSATGALTVFVARVAMLSRLPGTSWIITCCWVNRQPPATLGRRSDPWAPAHCSQLLRRCRSGQPQWSC